MLVRPRAVPPIAPFLGPSRETWLPWEEIGRGPLRDGPDIAPIQHDIFAGGTFARTTEASYLIGPANNGSSPFMLWAPAGVRRIENRGDGLGDMLLMEGSRTNTFRNSEDFTAVWSLVNATLPGATFVAPDGDPDGDGPFTPSAANGRAQQTISTLTDGQQVAISAWALDSAAHPLRFNVVGRDAVSNLSADLPAAAAVWGRLDYSINVGTGVASVLAGPYTGTTQQAIDRVWGAQLEVGYFPTSYIRTTAAAVTRSLESLQYAAGTYPAEFLTNGFRCWCAPDFSSADMLAMPASSFTSFVLGFSSASVGLSFRRDSVSNYSVRIVGSAGAATIVNPTWSRGQLLTLTCQNVGSGNWSITLAGATTGNGTTVNAVTMPVGAIMFVGTNTSSANPFFGRIGRYIEAL